MNIPSLQIFNFSNEGSTETTSNPGVKLTFDNVFNEDKYDDTITIDAKTIAKMDDIGNQLFGDDLMGAIKTAIGEGTVGEHDLGEAKFVYTAASGEGSYIYFDPTGNWNEKDGYRPLTLLDVLHSTTAGDSKKGDIVANQLILSKKATGEEFSTNDIVGFGDALCSAGVESLGDDENSVLADHINTENFDYYQITDDLNHYILLTPNPEGDYKEQHPMTESYFINEEEGLTPYIDDSGSTLGDYDNLNEMFSAITWTYNPDNNSFTYTKEVTE